MDQFEKLNINIKSLIGLFITISIAGVLFNQLGSTALFSNNNSTIPGTTIALSSAWDIVLSFVGIFVLIFIGNFILDMVHGDSKNTNSKSKNKNRKQLKTSKK